MEKNDFLKLKPMLLQEIDEPFNHEDYLFELKYDGLRALIYINNNRIIIKSRRGIILNDTYPELLAIKNISKDTCVFDGEIVLFENSIPSFQKLGERVKLKNKLKIAKMSQEYPVTFVCFDILYQNKDLTNTPLISRKNILNKFIDTESFIKSKYFEKRGLDLFDFVKKENLEGIVAKKKNSPYLYGKRCDYWVKIKNWQVNNFYICGYLKNKNDNTISVLLGEKKKNKYIFVGKVLFSNKNKLFKEITNTIPIKNYLENYSDNAIFIEPNHKIKIHYMERTTKGMLRQPFIKR